MRHINSVVFFVGIESEGSSVFCYIFIVSLLTHRAIVLADLYICVFVAFSRSSQAECNFDDICIRHVLPSVQFKCFHVTAIGYEGTRIPVLDTEAAALV